MTSYMVLNKIVCGQVQTGQKKKKPIINMHLCLFFFISTAEITFLFQFYSHSLSSFFSQTQPRSLSSSLSLFGLMTLPSHSLYQSHSLLLFLLYFFLSPLLVIPLSFLPTLIHLENPALGPIFIAKNIIIFNVKSSLRCRFKARFLLPSTNRMSPSLLPCSASALVSLSLAFSSVTIFLHASQKFIPLFHFLLAAPRFFFFSSSYTKSQIIIIFM